MLALIPARVSSLFLRFHRINGLAGQCPSKPIARPSEMSTGCSLEVAAAARRSPSRGRLATVVILHIPFAASRRNHGLPRAAAATIHPQNTPRSQIQRSPPPRARVVKCVRPMSDSKPLRTGCNPGFQSEASTETKHARKEAGTSHPSIDPRKYREPPEFPIPTIGARNWHIRITVVPTNLAERTATRRSSLLARELFNHEKMDDYLFTATVRSRDGQMKSCEPVTFVKLVQRQSFPAMERIRKGHPSAHTIEHRDEMTGCPDFHPDDRGKTDLWIKGFAENETRLHPFRASIPGQIPSLRPALITVGRAGDFTLGNIHSIATENRRQAGRAAGRERALSAYPVFPMVGEVAFLNRRYHRFQIWDERRAEESAQGKHQQHSRQPSGEQSGSRTERHHTKLAAQPRTKRIKPGPFRQHVQVIQRHHARRERQHPHREEPSGAHFPGAISRSPEGQRKRHQRGNQGKSTEQIHLAFVQVFGVLRFISALLGDAL